TLCAQGAAEGKLDFGRTSNGDGAHCAVKLPRHAEIGHPTDGVVRALDQHCAQLWIGPPASDAFQVSEIVRTGVGLDPDSVWVVVASHDRNKILDTVVGETEHAAGEAGVPASQL